MPHDVATAVRAALQRGVHPHLLAELLERSLHIGTPAAVVSLKVAELEPAPGELEEADGDLVGDVDVALSLAPMEGEHALPERGELLTYHRLAHVEGLSAGEVGGDLIRASGDGAYPYQVLVSARRPGEERIAWAFARRYPQAQHALPVFRLALVQAQLHLVASDYPAPLRWVDDHAVLPLAAMT